MLRPPCVVPGDMTIRQRGLWDVPNSHAGWPALRRGVYCISGKQAQLDADNAKHIPLFTSVCSGRGSVPCSFLISCPVCLQPRHPQPYFNCADSVAEDAAAEAAAEQDNAAAAGPGSSLPAARTSSQQQQLTGSAEGPTSSQAAADGGASSSGGALGGEDSEISEDEEVPGVLIREQQDAAQLCSFVQAGELLFAACCCACHQQCQGCFCSHYLQGALQGRACTAPSSTAASVPTWHHCLGRFATLADCLAVCVPLPQAPVCSLSAVVQYVYAPSLTSSCCCPLFLFLCCCCCSPPRVLQCAAQQPQLGAAAGAAVFCAQRPAPTGLPHCPCQPALPGHDGVQQVSQDVQLGSIEPKNMV